MRHWLVQATGSRNHEQQSVTGHQHSHLCWASASSGIPPREPLFNGSICRAVNLAWLQAALSRGRDVSQIVEVMVVISDGDAVDDHNAANNSYDMSGGVGG